jgi:thiol-disulfide isomerase/thioredoxin
MKLLFFLPALLILVLFNGCRENETKTVPSGNTGKLRSITLIDAEELNEIINNRNGKTLLINVWATWCKPCVEEFPDLIKIAGEYKNKNLEFLSLNVDFGKNADSLAAAFLAKQNNPGLMVYIVPEKSTEQVIELLNKEWDGSIPATFIYDADAEQKSFLLGSQDYDVFKKYIDSVMNLKI